MNNPKNNFKLKSNKNKKKNNSFLPILIIVLALVVVGIACIIGFKSCNKEIDDTQAVLDDTTEVETTTETTTAAVQLPDHAKNISLVAVYGEVEPKLINPLTGLPLENDVASNRPVAIMINNIHVACPQIGVSKADILYECLAEGGITRLEMLSQDYGLLDEVGSIRSSRKYFIDMAQNHDAIYVHAGGSDEAYSEIKHRNINHLDGVRTDAISGKDLSGKVFYRDSWRRANMGYEHSMMSNGELITSGIQTMNYRTEIKEGFNNPMHFAPYGYKVDLQGENATYCTFEYRSNDKPEFEYNETTQTYYRFQYGHEKHIDGANNEQLNFTNVLLLVMDHKSTGDAKAHINIDTLGSGTCYYLTGGKYIKCTWSRTDDDEPMVLTDSEGYPLILNKGKTMINVISPKIENTLVIE